MIMKGRRRLKPMSAECKPTSVIMQATNGTRPMVMMQMWWDNADEHELNKEIVLRSSARRLSIQHVRSRSTVR